MPQQSSPPYVTGSLSIPRTLIRWLDINYQNGPLSRTATYITLPAFSVASTWLGYSQLVASYNAEGPNNFSLTGGNMEPTSPNYLLAISWNDGKGNVYRYALWDNVGEVMLFDLPLYTGQLIKKNFRFEVWTTNSTPAIQTANINFYTTVAGNLDYRYGLDSVLVNNDGQVTNFASNATRNNSEIVPTTNLLAWFRSDYGVSGTGGNATWLAKQNAIGSFTSLSQVDGSGSPATSNDSALQRLVIQDGTVMGTSNVAGVVLPNNFTIFMLVKLTAYTNGAAIFAIANDAQWPFGSYLTLVQTTNGLQFGDYLGISASVSMDLDRWYVIQMSYAISTHTLTFNAVPLYNLSSPPLTTVSTTAFSNLNTISTFDLNNAFILGTFELAEIIIYSADPSALSAVYTYYKNYYMQTFTLPLTFPTNSMSQTN